MTPRPVGSATAFEQVVDDYDAGRPRYPAALFAALPALAGSRVLELGAGTGIATQGLLERGADVVATDLGPRMLGRLHRAHPAVPVVVARAERLPFASASYDGVCGAQMWHWTGPGAAAEVARVLRPAGWLALWWNEVAAAGQPWWQAQQDRLEAGNPDYRRDYRDRDYAAELTGAGAFTAVVTWHGSWQRELDWPTYERWLRSKSYVQALDVHGRPGAVEDFVAAERASLAQAFPGGVIIEPFTVVRHLATRA